MTSCSIPEHPKFPAIPRSKSMWTFRFIGRDGCWNWAEKVQNNYWSIGRGPIIETKPLYRLFSHNVVTMETVQLDGHHDWLHFDTYWSLNNCTCSCMRQWHDSFRSRGIKMESIKVAIQLHWFLWPPRYVKLVYTSVVILDSIEGEWFWWSLRQDRNFPCDVGFSCLANRWPFSGSECYKPPLVDFERPQSNPNAPVVTELAGASLINVVGLHSGLSTPRSDAAKLLNRSRATGPTADHTTRTATGRGPCSVLKGKLSSLVLVLSPLFFLSLTKL